MELKYTAKFIGKGFSVVHGQMEKTEKNHIPRFHELMLRVPSRSEEATLATFMDGPKPEIRQQIVPHVTTLLVAEAIASKVDSCIGPRGRTNVSSSGGCEAKQAGNMGNLGAGHEMATK